MKKKYLLIAGAALLLIAGYCFFAPSKSMEMPMDDMEMSMDEEMDMEMPMDDMMMLELDRTDALVILGTTGMTEAYAMEQGGTYKGKVSGAFTSTDAFKKALTMEEMETNAGFFGFAPEIAVVDGFTFRMVAPAHSPDNFVVLCEDGVVYRFDLGVDEMTNELTLVGKY